MADGGVAEERAAGLQVLDDVLVGLLDVAAGVVGHLLGEAPLGVHRVDHGDALAAAGVEVVFAEGRRHVHQAGAVGGGDVPGGDDAEGARLAVALEVGEVGEERRVRPPHQLGALLRFQRHRLVAQHRLHQRLGHPVAVAVVVLHLHVRKLRAHRDRQVRGQRPRGRRPDEEELVVAPVEGHLERQRRVVHVAVVEARFHVGQRGRQAPRVGGDAQALVDEPLRVELLEDPPDALHEGGVHRLVVVLEVHPAAQAGDGLLPLAHVLEHALAAGLVEGAHAVLADGGGAGEVELLLHVHLDGQAVRVPAEAALDAVAAHRPVAGDDVLERGGHQVPVVRQAGGERGAVVEEEALVGRALSHGAAKGVVLLPQRQHGFFFAGKRDLGRDGLEGAHGQRDYRGRGVGARSRRTSSPAPFAPRGLVEMASRPTTARPPVCPSGVEGERRQESRDVRAGPRLRSDRAGESALF